MKKIKVLLIVLLVFGLFSILILPENLQAAVTGPVFGGRLIDGVYYQNYYIAPSAGGYSDKINVAMSEWNNSTGAPWVWTPIWITQTGNPNHSRIDFHAEYNYDIGYTSVYTRMYLNYVGMAWPWNSNYNWSEIYINNAWIPRYSWTVQKGVMAHEVGHAFGMAHTAYYYSIMCQNTDAMRVFIPQEIDLNTVNAIY